MSDIKSCIRRACLRRALGFRGYAQSVKIKKYRFFGSNLFAK